MDGRRSTILTLAVTTLSLACSVRPMVIRTRHLLTSGSARINAFMVPSVYFFYPETAYRSLEEMDEIFQECQGFKGAFDVVKIAKEKPRRYGKDGNLLINYDDTEHAHRRRSSAAGAGAAINTSNDPEKSDDNTNTSEERRERM